MSRDRSVHYWVENRGLDSLQEQVCLGCHVQTGFVGHPPNYLSNLYEIQSFWFVFSFRGCSLTYLRLSEINRVCISANIVVPLTLKKAIIISAETLEDVDTLMCLITL
jgi:hypothetical protein